VSEARCAVCGQALALFSAPVGPVKCFRCHEANAILAKEKLKRIEAQRKKADAETRKINRKKTGEEFRSK
jgi:phage FluMu protein Com